MTKNFNLEVRTINYFSPEYNQELEIRDKVLRQPLNMSIYNDNLENDEMDVHIAAFINNEMAGVLLLKQINTDTVKVRQVAVIQKFQNFKIGTALSNFAEQFAKDKGYLFVELNARKTAVGFYEKQGYQISSDEFLEINLPHFKMSKSLYR